MNSKPIRYHLPYNPHLKEKARQLRGNMTPAEKKLWFEYLRSFSYPVLRQKPIDNYIVDFYCPKLKLVVEIDGDTHYLAEGKGYDDHRTAILESYGLKIIRFTNIDVMDGFDSVCEAIGNKIPLRPL